MADFLRMLRCNKPEKKKGNTLSGQTFTDAKRKNKYDENLKGKEDFNRWLHMRAERQKEVKPN